LSGACAPPRPLNCTFASATCIRRNCAWHVGIAKTCQERKIQHAPRRGHAPDNVSPTGSSKAVSDVNDRPFRAPDNDGLGGSVGDAGVVEHGEELAPPGVEGAGQAGQLGDVRVSAVDQQPVQQLLRTGPVGGPVEPHMGVPYPRLTTCTRRVAYPKLGALKRRSASHMDQANRVFK